jgi:hypothetical protein
MRMSFVSKQIETELAVCFYLFRNETNSICARISCFVSKNLLYQKRCGNMLKQSLLFPVGCPGYAYATEKAVDF